MTSFRFDKGGLIDRNRFVNFSFDGKPMQGHAGDTLASALLANGQLLMGRSFKYHRPRSVITAGAAEPNALMEIGEGGRLEPNTRATMQELYDGLIARSQNRWPTLDRDFGAINSIASSLFVAGFYYKTFMWPKRFWEAIYEPIIRRAAGLGHLSHENDPDRYEKAYAHCDVLVVGSGALTHNPGEIRRLGRQLDLEAQDWVTRFAAWTARAIAENRIDDLLAYRDRAPDAVRNHPTDEHLMPLSAALGAGGGQVPGRRLHDSTTFGVLAMDAYGFGAGAG